jgi:hypothetical protein
VNKTYRSAALGAVQETVQGLHQLGLVNTKTLREFALRCEAVESPARKKPYHYPNLDVRRRHCARETGKIKWLYE